MRRGADCSATNTGSKSSPGVGVRSNVSRTPEPSRELSQNFAPAQEGASSPSSMPTAATTHPTADSESAPRATDSPLPASTRAETSYPARPPAARLPPRDCRFRALDQRHRPPPARAVHSATSTNLARVSQQSRPSVHYPSPYRRAEHHPELVCYQMVSLQTARDPSVLFAGARWEFGRHQTVQVL